MQGALCVKDERGYRKGPRGKTLDLEKGCQNKLIKEPLNLILNYPNLFITWD